MTKIIPIHYCLLFIITGFTAGCGQPADNSYFPLTGELSWEYRTEYRVKEEPRTQRLIYLSRPPVEVDLKQYYSRVSLNGERYFYQKTDEGIVHVDPVSGDRSTVLAHPIEAQQSWQKTSRIGMLEVTGAFSEAFKARVTRPITMDYVIESTNESVAVEGGRYDNCIRVKGKGRLFAGRTLQEYLGIDSVFIEQTEWYAPGIGLVKKVRDEYTAPNAFKNTYTQELLAFVRR